METSSPGLVLSFDGGTLVLEGPRARDLLAPHPELVFDPRVGVLRTAGCRYRSLVETLVERGIPHEDRARSYHRLEGFKGRYAFAPFPHQQEALSAWVSAGMRGTVVLPTGAGKTYVAQLAIAQCRRDCLVVVPTLDLQSQWVSVLSSWSGTQVGVVGGGAFDVRSITVITYDSAVRHMDHLGHRFGLLIFDECHHLPAPAYRSIAEMGIAPFRLGLTATPDRSDGGEELLDILVGPVVYRSAVSHLAGYILAPYHTVRVRVELTDQEAHCYQEARKGYLDFCRFAGVQLGSLSGWTEFLRIAARTPRGREAFAAYRRQKDIPLNAENKFFALGTILNRHPEDRILIFTHVNALAYRISRSYLIPVITHQTPTKERAGILSAFSAGESPAVVTSRVLNEGVDVPDANVGVVLSGSSSVREHVQRLGRILRRKAGKKAVLYEILASDTHEEGISRRRRKHEAYGRQS